MFPALNIIISLVVLSHSVVSPGQEVGEEGPDSDVEGEPGCHPGAMGTGTFSNVIISL